jgi:hypothetical protein
MESGHTQNLSPTKSPGEAERPESPLTGLEFDMARLSLEAQNEGLREKVHELQTELMDGKSHEQYLRREQVVEAKQIREEERKRAQAMVSEVRRKCYKEKQQEVHELREKLHREKEKEITYIIKQKDEEFRKAQLSWNREKDDLVQKLRVQFTNEVRCMFCFKSYVPTVHYSCAETNCFLSNFLHVPMMIEHLNTFIQ